MPNPLQWYVMLDTFPIGRKWGLQARVLLLEVTPSLVQHIFIIPEHLFI